MPRGLLALLQYPVTISGFEAELLAKASVRATTRPHMSLRLAELRTESDIDASQARLTGSACPFLQDATCSVYEHRPIACRTLFNLDDDDLLCRHAPDNSDDAAASMPYADARMLKALSVMAQPGFVFADIREFFAKLVDEEVRA